MEVSVQAIIIIIIVIIIFIILILKSDFIEAQIDPNPFHSLMSAIGLRRKLCKRNSEQVIDSYYSPNKHQKSQLNSVCGILFTEYPGFCFETVARIRTPNHGDVFGQIMTNTAYFILCLT